MPKISLVKHFVYKQKEKEKGTPSKSKAPIIRFVSKSKDEEKKK